MNYFASEPFADTFCNLADTHIKKHFLIASMVAVTSTSPSFLGELPLYKAKLNIHLSKSLRYGWMLAAKFSTPMESAPVFLLL